MFPVDTMPAHYFEERQAAETNKRQAYIQKQQAAQAAALSAALQANKKHQPSSTTSSLNRPRPEGASLLGNILQGFVRANSTPSSGTSTPVYSPLMTPQKMMTQAEIEALMAEKRREADKCAMPAWYH